MSDYIQKIESDYNEGKIGYDEFTDLEYVYYTSTFEEQEKLNSNVKRESELIENKSSEAESKIPNYYSEYIQKVEADYKNGKIDYDEYSNLKYVYYASTLDQQKELNSSIMKKSEMGENEYSEVELNKPIGINVDFSFGTSIEKTMSDHVGDAFERGYHALNTIRMIVAIIVIIIIVFALIFIAPILKDL